MKVSASQIEEGILQRLARAAPNEMVELSIGLITDRYPLGKDTVNVKLTFGGEANTWRNNADVTARISVTVDPTVLNGVSYREAEIDCRQNAAGGWYVSARVYRVGGWERGTDAAYKAYSELGRQVCREYGEIARGLAKAAVLVTQYNSLVSAYRRFQEDRKNFIDLAERLQDVNP